MIKYLIKGRLLLSEIQLSFQGLAIRYGNQHTQPATTPFKPITFKCFCLSRECVS